MAGCFLLAGAAGRPLSLRSGVVLVVLSYREVVSVYTKAGGSYVVARENFGPRVAQVAAVALLIDYVVTVAVQTAAGSAAIVSAFPALSRIPVIGPKILLVHPGDAGIGVHVPGQPARHPVGGPGLRRCLTYLFARGWSRWSSPAWSAS